MGIGYAHRKIIEGLYNNYKIQGYITEDNISAIIDQYNLPLDEVDYICDLLLSKGVIIINSLQKQDHDEDVYDYSIIDYEEIFQEVVAIENSLTPFIDEVRQIKPPQRLEWQNLIPQAKNGNIYARHRIIKMYLRTAIKIALQNHKKYKTPLAETIQEACIGLVIALDHYEVGMQEKFSSYASNWVRQNIARNALIFTPLMPFPDYVNNKLISIYDILEKFNFESCPEMLEEVSEKLSCIRNEAEEYVNYFNKVESIDELLKNDEMVFSDHYAFEEQILNNLYKEEFKNKVVKILETLKPEEKKVILLRFLNEEGWTLEKVGHKLGVTRERVRQVEKKALEKISKRYRQQSL